MLVIGGVGLLYAHENNSTSATHATATANAQATANVHVRGTANVQATVTAAVNAYNTATAKGVMFGFDPQHTHVNPYERVLNPTNVSRLVSLWTASTGDSIESSPVVANDIVYVGSSDDKLYAFNASGCGQPSCSPLWTSTGSSITSSPAVANGIVYVSAYDGELYAFNASGCGQPSCSPLWTALPCGPPSLGAISPPRPSWLTASSMSAPVTTSCMPSSPQTVATPRALPCGPPPLGAKSAPTPPWPTASSMSAPMTTSCMLFTYLARHPEMFSHSKNTSWHDGVRKREAQDNAEADRTVCIKNEGLYHWKPKKAVTEGQQKTVTLTL